jgi:glycosyltransferase involved in cell wall biosynthesis
LVEVDDPVALAAAILRVLDEADLRERLGRRARRTVETTYSIDLVARRYIALYGELTTAATFAPSTGGTAGTTKARPV